MDYTCTWGLYQCFQGTDDDMIDVNDREKFFSLRPNGKVFYCVSMEGDKMVLKYGESEFRVKPELYRVVKEPQYKLGDEVEIIEKKLTGRVIAVNWHIKDNAPFYFVKTEGKKSSKRYRNCELKKVK